MSLSKFGFIVTGAGLEHAQHRAVLRSNRFEMIVIGVSDPAHGPAAARLLLQEGVQLIELCGGFGPRWSAEVLETVAKRVPVGVVSYGASEIPALHALFGD